jgi:predicted nucleic acid-binding protein
MATSESDPGEEIAFPRRLYLDTQFCFAYVVERDRDHEAADAFALTLKQTSEANLVECFVSTLVLDELMWRLGGVLYDEREGRGSWAAADKSAAFVSVRSEVAGVIEDFVSEPWVLLVRPHQRTAHIIPRLLRRHELAAADLCHLALAYGAGLALVTNDDDFHGLPNPPVRIVGY